jgi:hypothetical protein
MTVDTISGGTRLPSIQESRPDTQGFLPGLTAPRYRCEA